MEKNQNLGKLAIQIYIKSKSITIILNPNSVWMLRLSKTEALQTQMLCKFGNGFLPECLYFDIFIYALTYLGIEQFDSKDSLPVSYIAIILKTWIHFLNCRGKKSEEPAPSPGPTMILNSAYTVSNTSKYKVHEHFL